MVLNLGRRLGQVLLNLGEQKLQQRQVELRRILQHRKMNAGSLGVFLRRSEPNTAIKVSSGHNKVISFEP
jgi:hypothetical protein